MVTPPWMKHMTTTTPFSELLSTTTSKNVSAESTTESSNITSAGTTSTLATSTMKTTNLSKPTLPPPMTTKPSNTSTVKPAKTTKSPKTTTQKTTVATTTAKAETSTTEIPSTLPTTKSNSTAATPARLTTATENISTTLGDLNDTSVPPLIDVTDYTSSTRVTRRMPGSSEQTFETYVPSMPTLTISNVGETPIPFDLSTPTTQSLQTAVLPETDVPFSSTLGTTRSQQEPSLSSMLTTLGGGKTSDAGLTTAFIIMAMTTKEFSPANLTAMFPQSLNLVTNEQIMLQSTTPIPAESSTAQASSTTSATETTIPESSTVTFEKLQSSYSSSTTPLTTEVTETTTETATETTTEMTSEESMTTQRNEDYSYSTQTEYMSTTEITTETMETTEPENVDVSLPTPTTISSEIPTTTESGDLTSNPTETTSFPEETTTEPSETENPLGEEGSPKSRQKRLAKGEKNFFPELQLHLHGNAMLSADDKDMDTIWQKYQERFGLPQGPFQVFNQGQEPLVKWVPIIRMVKRLPFAYSSRLQAQALMLPLDDERYKLLLILPVGGEDYEEGWRPTRQRRSYPFQQNEARDLALLRLIDDLHSVPLREIVSSVQHCLVAATIPPFLIRGMLDLTPTLARVRYSSLQIICQVQFSATFAHVWFSQAAEEINFDA
ncbi:hypothetical protein J437_LFUL007087 [Ladona fulva]|uniref:Uncharacterized protein n=1 Tax=Ladona fulva TaxID=123851 RepID=A0A8K0NW90_LADFU|nr:hypothetical protein J437_LFUL007087 [Ladona fulva]